MTDRPTVMGLAADLREHVAECNQRNIRIEDKIDDLLKVVGVAVKVGLGALISLTAWLALQVYDGVKDRPVVERGAQAATLK